MIDVFLLKAGLAGIGVAAAAGPLGSFVIWRRMAFFGDATAHAALLGVALALAFRFPIWIGVLSTALLMAWALSNLRARTLPADSALGVLAYSALAAGLVAISFVPRAQLGLDAFLFGDILTVDWDDLAVIWLGAAAIIALLVARWPALLTATLNPEMARASGIDPEREERILIIAMAILVALAVTIVGALLIAAILVIPAATARRVSKTPESMALFASLIGAMAVVLGLGGAVIADTPAGPSIVTAAAALFVLSLTVRA
ncbi:MAG: iron chelate uptake ABC transporter family permease subunit [Pseudomonadota bacterium]